MMINRLSNIFQFILGFVIGIALITGLSVGLGLIYISKLSMKPPKPNFPQVKSEINLPENATSSSSSEANTEANPEPETIEEPEEPELPPDAYKARVTWPQGLSLREEPDVNAARIGGVEHNAEIIILEETRDKQWQRVRLPWSEQEGWVKGGNVERVY
jgi:hypothetical protein